MGKTGRIVAAGLVLGWCSACEGNEATAPAWESAATTMMATADEGGTTLGAETSADCSPGEVVPCLCDDGLTLGEAICDDDGLGLSACECEMATDGGETGDPMPPLPDEVCFLGADGLGNTCLPLIAFYADLPRDYEYPTPTLPSGQDRPPLALVDVQATSGSLSLAPNFVFDELAQPQFGQWAVVQPHAVEALQAMRDQAGAISVLTGYRSPAANAAQGGAPDARFIYGDGFDLEPLETTIPTLAGLCSDEGGTPTEFPTYLHCEFSATPLDEAFFGPA